ncbi:MAG: radical SAM protein [Bacteroidota bacterium]|nr:radical SAM protein [Bacteroidota bacterium]
MEQKTRLESRKTLLLINPVDKDSKGYVSKYRTRYEPLNLGIIAALTPPGWKIKILDENLRDFRYYPADLVGFTAMTPNANRVYELSAIYREKGIPTVMGGIHASMCPDEAARYVDTVLIGEAESIWGKIIEDFNNHNLQKFYHGELTNLIESPKPRRDLYFPGYFFGSIQTSRGCPMNCNFCSVTAFNGQHYRFRPIDEVIAEMKEIPQKVMNITDDNIIGYSKQSKERAIALFKAMIDAKLNKFWISHASLNIADDKEVLYYAQKSGCKLLFIGIESDDESQLKDANKKLNLKMGVKSYNKVFRRLHKYGIGVVIGTIYGFESETKETVDRRVNFFRKCQADSVQSTVMTPLPGTGLFKKLESEGRLEIKNFPEDWRHYSFEELNYTPDNLPRKELMDYILKKINEIYEPSLIRHRFYRSLWQTKSLSTAYLGYMSYWFYRNAVCQNWEPSEFKWVEKLLRKMKVWETPNVPMSPSQSSF